MREKLIKLLDDFSAPVMLMDTKLMDWNIPTQQLREAIADYLIANDVVPVVRCKDCKQYTPERLRIWDDKTLCYTFKTKIAPFGECSGQDFTYTEDGSLCVNENDFCSCGERKDND